MTPCQFWLMTKLPFWMTLCPSSQIFTDHQTHFSYFEWYFVRRHKFLLIIKLIFRFLNDPMSVVTHFDYWWPNSLFEWLFVRRHRFLLMTKLIFHFLNNPLSVVKHFDWWQNSLFEGTLCPWREILTSDNFFKQFFWSPDPATHFHQASDPLPALDYTSTKQHDL